MIIDSFFEMLSDFVTNKTPEQIRDRRYKKLLSKSVVIEDKCRSDFTPKIDGITICVFVESLERAWELIHEQIKEELGDHLVIHKFNENV